MPWSEWQASALFEGYWVNTALVATSFSADAGTEPRQTADVTTATGGPNFLTQWRASDAEPFRGQFQGVQMALDPAWETARDWFPQGLHGLTAGVDYDVRPDRTTSDQDAYVEYEDGPNVGAQTTLDAGLSVDGIASSFGSQPFRVGVTLNTAYAPGEVTVWPVGTTIGTGDASTTPVGASYAAGFPLSGLYPAGSARSFTVVTELTGDQPPALTTESLANVSLRKPSMRLLYRMPRWRYWIPGVVAYPIRQRQRNDGLGRGVVRARGTSSVQNSVRQRGYR